MSKIAEYTALNYYNTVQQKNQKESGIVRNGRTDETSKTDKTRQPQLSKRAQKLLEKLRKTYDNMDFMVADFDNGEDAKAILSRGTKEFSVLLSSEELEKMASDETYEKEYMERIQGAVRMSEQINSEHGFGSALGKGGEESRITKMGVAFNKDGTMTYFAELEKMSEKQQERIEKAREERAEAESNRGIRGINPIIKKTTVQASSAEELLKKISEVDWSKVKEERKEEGSRFDFSI